MYQTPLNSIKSLQVLLSPLNWGLGHVSRTIPIIQKLIHQNNEVLICCDQEQETFYRHYFPQLQYIFHQGYPFQFKGKGNWTLDLLSNFNTLHRRLITEKQEVQRLVDTFQPDLIISDQRYGFISKQVKSVIISHQLKLPLPTWNFLPQIWNQKLLTDFDEIWIPDIENHLLSGDLSKKKMKNIHFLGFCSRFSSFFEQNKEKAESSSPIYKYLGVISGPSPYKEQFFELLCQKLIKTDQNSAIIVPKGVNVDLFKESKKLTFFISPNVHQFSELLLQSEKIISRAGYSTLMDLTVLKKEAILIPTPRQFEQIYLAKLHKNNKMWTFLSEKDWKVTEL